MKSAFISHSWHDKRLARLIADTLQRLGGRVWLDDAEIKLGDSLIQKIRSGIDTVDYVVALISKVSVTSEWVSKELDIAMTQEIEGRRVKVLPVLASKCPLPGFLKGKLYADMSSPRAIQRSLPMLLERLEAPPDALSAVRAGKSPERLSDNRWVSHLSHALASNDPSIRYAALKDAKTWQAKALLADVPALHAVFGLLDARNGAHLRVRALKLLQGIEDDAFSYQIEPLLGDVNPHVVVGAIDCLSGLKARGSAMRILELLKGPTPPEVLRASLEYFSKVELRDETVILSLLATCDQLLKADPNDVGLRLAGLRALANQVSSGAALSIVPRVLDALTTGPDEVRLSLLDAICEKGEDLWIPQAPHLRTKLRQAVLECAGSPTAPVAAASWLAVLLMPDIAPAPSSRRTFWTFIAAADEDSLACWFERMSEYQLDALFDKAEDVAGLGAILGRFGGRFDEDVCDALCQIGSYSALKLVSETCTYEPKGWAKAATLRALASLDTWDPNLSRLLGAAKKDLPEFEGSMGKAWALLADFKAGLLDVKTLSERFPSTLRRTDDNSGQLRPLRNVLKHLKILSTDRPAARRLASILKKLDQGRRSS